MIATMIATSSSFPSPFPFSFLGVDAIVLLGNGRQHFVSVRNEGKMSTVPKKHKI
jgi:hypothetical protein